MNGVEINLSIFNFFKKNNVVQHRINLYRIVRGDKVYILNWTDYETFITHDKKKAAQFADNEPGLMKKFPGWYKEHV